MQESHRRTERFALILGGLVLGVAIPLVVFGLGRSAGPAPPAIEPAAPLVSDAGDVVEADVLASAEASVLTARLAELGYEVTPSPPTTEGASTREPSVDSQRPAVVPVNPPASPRAEPQRPEPARVEPASPTSRQEAPSAAAYERPVYENEPEERVTEPAPPPTPTVITAVLPAGRSLALELTEALSSRTAVAGQEFRLRLAEAAYLPEGVSIPAGAAVSARVHEVERGRRPQKPGRLVLVAEALQVDGDWYAITAPLSAEGEAIKGRGSHEEDAQRIGIGAAAGTIIGAILEGKKGAIAGLVLGGGGVFLATRGEDVELPAGTSLTAVLEEDLVLHLPAR